MRSGGSETCSLTIARWRCREASPCRVQAPQPEAASGDRRHKTVITAPAELATSKSHTRDAWHNWARSQQPRPQDITVSRQQRFAHRAFSQHLPQKYASPARGSGRDVYDPVTIIVAYAPRHRCMGGDRNVATTTIGPLHGTSKSIPVKTPPPKPAASGVTAPSSGHKTSHTHAGHSGHRLDKTV